MFLTERNTESRVTVRLDEHFNPYKDTTPSVEQAELETPGEREPFNDYVAYQDTVVGHQRNRTLSDYPRKLRPWVRISAIISLLVIAGGIVWDISH